MNIEDDAVELSQTLHFMRDRVISMRHAVALIGPAIEHARPEQEVAIRKLGKACSEFADELARMTVTLRATAAAIRNHQY